MKSLNLIDKAFFLKHTTLFHTLDLNLLLAIADKLSLLAFDSQEIIFTLQEEAKRMYFIVQGEVHIYPATKEIKKLYKGDFFGEESLFNDSTRSYQATAATNTHLLALSRTNLYAIISECPSVALSFLQVYTSFMTCRAAYLLPESL